MAVNKMRKWVGYHFSTGGNPGSDYIAFQKDARADLRQKAADTGCSLVKFNKGHYEFSAILKHDATGAYVYVSISDVRFSQDKWYTNVLYRMMNDKNDWTGRINNYCRWEDLFNSIKQLVNREAT